MHGKPSIAVWIDPATQEVKNDFRPQELKPAEYGIVLGCTIVHIARCFVQANSGIPEDEVIAEIQRGIDAGIAQREPAAPMSAH